jgi:shikimate kinase
MKTVFLLIGPKGSGKSYIGALFRQKFNIPFIRVEDWVKELKRDKDFSDESYISQVFQIIESGIVKELEDRQNLVFESTGYSHHFDRMLANLKLNHRVVLIKIKAGKDLCLQRVKSREQAIHIPYSDADITAINEAVERKVLPFDFEIDNNSPSSSELERVIAAIVKGVK